MGAVVASARVSDLLLGKVIAITGAGAGLGRAYAVAAARVGATLVLSDRDEAALAQVVDELAARGVAVVGVPGDVVDPDVGPAITLAALRGWGRIDGLVANAGIRPEGLAWEEDPLHIRRALEVNVLGVVQCALPAMRAMRSRGSGSIVTVTSRAAAGIAASASYAATKGAIASLSSSWAIDLASAGVRVNTIAPQAGATGTRRAAHEAADEPRPEQMAPLVVYLLSQLSAAVTGQVLRLSGSDRALSLAWQAPAVIGPSLGVEPRWSAESIAAAIAGAGLPPVGAERRSLKVGSNSSSAGEG